MDCSSDKGEPWDWQGGDCCLENGSRSVAISPCLWDVVTQNEEDFSCMFDDATPVKACGDFSSLASRGDSSSDKMTEEQDDIRGTSSQVKRRRMLTFSTQTSNPSFCSEITSTFLESNETAAEAIEDDFSDPLNWGSGVPDTSSSGCEGLDQPSEDWLAECFNDVGGMHLNADSVNVSLVSDVQIDVTEYCNFSSESEANLVQEQVPRAPPPQTGFKGRKANMRAPRTITSSIAYPFAFIKPCAVHGDVTLKDINQRIRAPPPRKLDQSNGDLSCYPTSAISGKPVVGKTKICTDGGKGSITITRTKG